MLAKTPLGRDALLDRSSSLLTPVQRQILILSNGKRGTRALVNMMGQQVLPHIEYLLEIGLLIENLGKTPNPEFVNSSLDSFIDVSDDF